MYGCVEMSTGSGIQDLPAPFPLLTFQVLGICFFKPFLNLWVEHAQTDTVTLRPPLHTWSAGVFCRCSPPEDLLITMCHDTFTQKTIHHLTTSIYCNLPSRTRSFSFGQSTPSKSIEQFHPSILWNTYVMAWHSMLVIKVTDKCTASSYHHPTPNPTRLGF